MSPPQFVIAPDDLRGAFDPATIGRGARYALSPQRAHGAHRIRPEPTLFVRQLASHRRHLCQAAAALSDRLSIGDYAATEFAKPYHRCGAAS